MTSTPDHADDQTTGAASADERATAGRDHGRKDGQSSDRSDDVHDVDPDAPGAALVDPTLEQVEPNEPG